jgi:hypothetical protein
VIKTDGTGEFGGGEVLDLDDSCFAAVSASGAGIRFWWCSWAPSIDFRGDNPRFDIFLVVPVNVGSLFVSLWKVSVGLYSR